MSAKLNGIFPALVTPMTPDEKIDHATLETFVDGLIDKGGVQGILPLGSTGEYYALDKEERAAVLKTVIRAVAGRVPVVAGTNAGATREVVTFCQEAEQLGAAGVLLAAPYYSLPTQDELFEHFCIVAESIRIPIMLYNYPGRTGVDMVPDLIVRLAEIDNIQYVKESSGDISRVSEIIRRCGEKLTVFCGCDTAALESFVLGAAGWVGGVANCLPREHVELYDLAVRKQDFVAAREPYYRLLPVLAMMEAGGKYTQFVKAGCQIMGRPVGPPRRPLSPAADVDIDSLKRVFEPFVR